VEGRRREAAADRKVRKKERSERAPPSTKFRHEELRVWGATNDKRGGGEVLVDGFGSAQLEPALHVSVLASSVPTAEGFDF
jgi:hypothetical protein